MSSDPSVETGRRVLRCDQCGRSQVATNADLGRYAATGWPECCGRAMAYFTEAARPEGTRFTHKCPACGHQWAITFPPGVEVVASTAAECERCRGNQLAAPRPDGPVP